MKRRRGNKKLLGKKALKGASYYLVQGQMGQFHYAECRGRGTVSVESFIVIGKVQG